MKKLDNKQLDEIGKALVRNDAALSRGLESVLADPKLFDGVRTRIASEKPARAKTGRYMRPAIAAFAGVTVVAVFAIVFVAFKPQPSVVFVQQPPALTKVADNKVGQFTTPDTIVDTKLESVDQPVRGAERITTRPTVQNSRPRQPEAQRFRPESNFYAVSYAGDPHETERGGRIVRVDIPRSTLFAMGVDIPLENEADVVKADLLIGPDGVTRGIRVVE